METETAGIGILIGAVLPLLISVVNRPAWSDRAKSLTALAICLLAAVASSFFVDGVDFREPGFDIVAYFATVYGSAMVTYSRFWKPTSVSPKIEANT